MISNDIRVLLEDASIDKELKTALLPHMIEAQNRAKGPWTKFFTSAPFAALLSAVLVASITEAIRLQSRGEELVHERNLERQKFQYEVITNSLSEAKTPKQRAETLRFLHDIKILTGLDDDKLKEWASENATPPSFESTSNASATTPLVQRTVEQYKELFGEDIYGPDTSHLIPSNADLEAVLGTPGQSMERCLVRVEFPYPMVIDWNRNQRSSFGRAHRSVAPYFEKAFQLIVEAGAQRHAELYGGMYNHRKKRGGSEWSVHAYGASIDLNPSENGLRSGPDLMTMHPDVVRAFKSAGFAWLGDRGFDGMSFEISTETLKEIANSRPNNPGC